MADPIQTNVDQVIKTLAKLESKATTKLVTEVRAGLKRVARNNLKSFRAITPKDTGALKKSLKVKSKSAKGKTRVFVTWWPNEYGAFVNYAKKSPHRHIFTNKFKSMKQMLDAEGTRAITGVYNNFLTDNGVKIKR